MKATDTSIIHTRAMTFLPKLPFLFFFFSPMINSQASSDQTTKQALSTSISLTSTALFKHSVTLATLPGVIFCIPCRKEGLNHLTKGQQKTDSKAKNVSCTISPEPWAAPPQASAWAVPTGLSEISFSLDFLVLTTANSCPPGNSHREQVDISYTFHDFCMRPLY